MGVCERREDGVVIRVKLVPGANRSRVVGVLGHHLKVQVALLVKAIDASTAESKLEVTQS